MLQLKKVSFYLESVRKSEFYVKHKRTSAEIPQFRSCTFQGIPPFFSRLPVGRQVLVLHTEKTKPFEAFGKSYPLAPYRFALRGVYLAGLLNGVFFAVLRNARIRKRGDSLHNH